MTEPPSPRLPITPPTVLPPPPFADRRVTYRRTTDRLAHRERVLLARSLDILAGDLSANDRLAALLRLLARTVGARRAAVLAGTAERRIATWVGPAEDPAAARELASWLDVHGPRTRAERAASAPAIVAIVIETDPDGDVPPRARTTRPSRSPHYACIPIPGVSRVVLGFDFGDPVASATLEERLPRDLARHAAVALALVTEQLTADRERVELRAREEERARYVATVAHDLRTPLTGLAGYLELILGGRVDDELVEREFLERSRGIVESMADLVGDLLELSRLDSGTLSIELGQVSIQEVGRRVIDRVAPIAGSRQIELSADLPPRLRGAIADHRRVEQVLTNLIGNALKFTPAGGGVELTARLDGPVAVMCVRDDGPGIGPGDRERIFERFYRMSGHARVTGTGLGLPIARELATAMGGDLGVASVPGTGSSFVLVLPAAEIDPATLAMALDTAISAEEQRLEERAVVRAIAGSGRPGPVQMRLVSQQALPTAANESLDNGEPFPRPVHLRSIDGSAGRPPRPTPA